MEEILNILYGNRINYKGINITKELLKNEEFRNIIIKGIKEHKISGFSDELIEKIDNQNIRRINSFLDIFKDGTNLGYCTVASKQLSYSFNNCYIVGGINKFLKNTTNSLDGSHTWIESDNTIYDTTFMLEIDKSYGKLLGYIEENRYDPNLDALYLSAKYFTNDQNLKK